MKITIDLDKDMVKLVKEALSEAGKATVKQNVQVVIEELLHRNCIQRDIEDLLYDEDEDIESGKITRTINKQFFGLDKQT